VLQRVAVRCRCIPCLSFPSLLRAPAHVFSCVAVGCSVLQCVAMFGSVLQLNDMSLLPIIIEGSRAGFFVCCSVLQRVAVCCDLMICLFFQSLFRARVAACGSVLQHVAVCCSCVICLSFSSLLRAPAQVSQRGAVCCSVLQCVAACGSVLQLYDMSLLLIAVKDTCAGFSAC